MRPPVPGAQLAHGYVVVSSAGGRDRQAKWSTIAVEPVGFLKTETNAKPFSGLLRDLACLAGLTERPKETRHARFGEILKHPIAEATANQLEAVDWLLRGRGDLWAELLAEGAAGSICGSSALLLAGVASTLSTCAGIIFARQACRRR